MTPHTILDLVARARGMLVSQLRGQLRHKRIAQARHEAAWLLRHETMLSYPDIGRLLGNRDHTTILAAVAKIEAQIAKDPSLLRLRASYAAAPAGHVVLGVHRATGGRMSQCICGASSMDGTEVVTAACPNCRCPVWEDGRRRFRRIAGEVTEVDKATGTIKITSRTS